MTLHKCFLTLSYQVYTSINYKDYKCKTKEEMIYCGFLLLIFLFLVLLFPSFLLLSLLSPGIFFFSCLCFRHLNYLSLNHLIPLFLTILLFLYCYCCFTLICSCALVLLTFLPLSISLHETRLVLSEFRATYLSKFSKISTSLNVVNFLPR